jgi:hypothetical protein
VTTTSQQIIEQIAAKLGHPVYNPVSSRALGQVLGLSHTHVRRLQDGEIVLSRDAFVRACKFLELPPERIVELTLALNADGAEDEGLAAWMRGIAKGLRGNVVKSSASILIGAAAMIAHTDDAKSAGIPAFPAHSPTVEVVRDVCILC